jgi:hypothetical protein
VHLLLSPGASHSGFEDHWQADAYHYFHHRYVSCNYAGTDAGLEDPRGGATTFSEPSRNLPVGTNAGLEERCRPGMRRDLAAEASSAGRP